ncbi:hypothetical protein [Streptomyces litchfieldiae]|uniref:Lipoprotein n=1 Tax=Streptomyces litchfieldiae TaxID=3075543 RepID=A0ABU2MKM8_9ACTN|nr:hypothetical protein [Streptomyces sp. DSM 44938]MDT0341214.1 hypothetical protein [Streptomyces sp. DSM 44938]
MSVPTRNKIRRLIALAALALLAPAAAGCGERQDEERGGPAARADPTTGSPGRGGAVDPEDFVDRIDNPFFPLEPGTRFRYEGATEEGDEVVEIEVTDEKKKILGVPTTVVHETVTRSGDLVEETRDWYAQDRAGNVWYFGEDTKEMKNGEVVSTEGSWRAGQDGAEPGIVMKARPQVGDKYAQENAPDVAEDRAEVLALDEKVKVPYGSFDDVLQTEDTNQLETDVVEHKFYGKGVGLLLERETEGGDDRLALTEVRRP